MTAIESQKVTAVLNEVRAWPAEMRLTLASEIVQSVRQEPPETARRPVPVSELIGLLSNGEPPPNDEECRRIIEEERIRKYG